MLWGVRDGKGVAKLLEEGIFHKSVVCKKSIVGCQAGQSVVVGKKSLIVGPHAGQALQAGG